MRFASALAAFLVLAVASPLLRAQSGTQPDKSPSRGETASQPGNNLPRQSPSKTYPAIGWKIVNVYPHDAGAFTQGLVYDRAVLYESTGLNGRSTLRKVELRTGRVLNTYRLPGEYFGEGLALWHDTLVQLTYKSGKAFVYDKESFTKQKELTYSGEGWGLTEDGTSLIMSDGSSVLRFVNPDTFAVQRRIEVQDHDGPVANLNELELVRGEVFANIWGEDRVARISPETGEVLGWIDFSPLRDELSPMQRVDVLNGIAYDTENNRLYVTGKLWPKLFEIELYTPETDQSR